MAARNRYFHWLAAALVAALLAFLSIPTHAAFQWSPVVNVYAERANIRGYQDAVAACSETGGYLSCEATDAVHALDVERGDAIGAGTWYAYLGGDTAAVRSPGLIQCAQDYSIASTGGADGPVGATRECVYRWNQGRWLTFLDDDTLVGNQFVYEQGIAFYLSNSWSLQTAGPANGMSNFFFNESVGGSDAWRRPGNFFGRYLLLVKNDGTGTETGGWTDGSPTLGNPYTSSVYTFRPAYGGSVFDYSGSSLSSFVSMCNAPTPSRNLTELSNTTSGLQANWWAIFFAILFVLCLIAFIIIVCCQEREDMDEPPEDAPEWAQKQAEDRQELKSYRSQRSFRSFDEDADADAATDTNTPPASQRANRMAPKEDDYADEESV